jgi:hypothetical protein
VNNLPIELPDIVFSYLPLLKFYGLLL